MVTGTVFPKTLSRSRGLAKGAVGCVLLSALCVAGCTVGPDFSPPNAPDVPVVSGRIQSPGRYAGDRQHYSPSMDIPGEWWALFHSKALTSLIERSLRDNNDLAAAQAALRAAHANYEAQRGALWPSLEATENSTRGKISSDGSNPTSGTSPYYTLHTKQVSLSYVPDVFGGVRRAIEQADAVKTAQFYQLEATYLTLTSNIALAAIQEASLRQLIKTTQQILGHQQDLLSLLKKQQSLGQVAEVDVALQEQAVAQARLSLIPLQKQLATTRDLLATLSGHFAGEGLPETFTFAALTLPETLPLSLPAEIIRHRPDVAAAEANVHAASAQVGVAVANRLPQFAITGNAGRQSTEFVNLFSGPPGFAFWTIAGNVAQPLFDGFTLEQKQRAAEAGLDQAVAQYRSTVLVAFQNVADVLVALEYDAKLLAAARASETATEKSLALVREQYKLGQVSSLDVINVQQANLQARLAVVQARAARMSDAVALFQALGGGWWNRSDAEPLPPHPLERIVNPGDAAGRKT